MDLKIYGIVFEREMGCVEKFNWIFGIFLKKKNIEEFESLPSDELTIYLSGDHQLIIMAIVLDEVEFDSSMRERVVGVHNCCFLEQIRVVKREKSLYFIFSELLLWLGKS